jgi:hypothetical protein
MMHSTKLDEGIDSLELRALSDQDIEFVSGGLTEPVDGSDEARRIKPAFTTASGIPVYRLVNWIGRNLGAVAGGASRGARSALVPLLGPQPPPRVRQGLREFRPPSRALGRFGQPASGLVAVTRP